jgi:hypothetical protein
MEIRVTIRGGSARVETISILEDLWHDFEYFKSRAARLDRPGASAGEHLRAKRYRRAAIVMLAFYFEGVVNSWLHALLKREEFHAIERKPLDVKVKRLLDSVGSKGQHALKTSAAKQFRNELAHLKPGRDLELFDKVTKPTLASSESTLVGWLTNMERLLGLSRHPNTEAESRGLRAALGESIPGSEGYTGSRARRSKAV